MTDAGIIEELRAILGDIAPDLEVSAIDANADLRNDVGLDSMDFLNFVIAVHKRLHVDVPEADYSKVDSLTKFARYIAAKGRPG